MSQAKPFSDLFRIRARFCRSVNITADVGDPDALSGYVVTPLTRAVLRRVGEGLRLGSRERCWSITGPYGAGKSACALFLAKVLGYPRSDDARQMLRGVDTDLYGELCEQIPGLAEGSFFVTPMVGSREPIAPAIIRGLTQALSSEKLISAEHSDLIGRLDFLYQDAQSGRQITVADFAEAVERVARVVRQSRREVLGLLIVIDELGKLLEHATLDPAHGDVFFLQALAELAARSGDYPIGVLTILHQAFEHYASRLGFLQQQEWSKVQGRFEDIAFVESPGELLRLVGKAIEPVKPQDGLTRVISEEAGEARALEIAPPELGRHEAVELLENCAPLHPTVALVLGRLFRSRLAQNERSLFAFLASGEVHGLQDYLRREAWTGNGYKPFYRLDELYDYVLSALGSSLYVHTQGKRWAEIADALDRLPSDCGPLEARLVKAIGMLSLLGDQQRLKASKHVLAYALADGRSASPPDVEKAIDRLVEYKIATYRRHKDAYGLWEGSDIDLDEQFQKGMASIDKLTSLADLLQTHGYLRPYIAKRHLHVTGTLRYFVPWVIDEAQLDEVLSRDVEPADGAVVFILGAGVVATHVIVEAALEASQHMASERKELLLFAIPQDIAGLREALEEIKAWEWVARNTKELHGDRVAREELRARLLDAQGRVTELCSKYFDKAFSYQSSVWIWDGRQVHFSSPAELSAAISKACDRAYSQAPKVHNELANRRVLSSAASAARRTLIERMLAEPTMPRLGMTGFPPELSMYRSVLEHTGLHHQAGDQWEFGPSTDEDPCHVRPLWQGIEHFLDTTESRKRPVSELFDLLRQPPYGIKDGLLPIFLAAAISHWDEELAVYEDGTFVPRIDIAAFERLMKAPQQFALQRYRLSEVRSYLFEQYSGLFKVGKDAERANTLLGAIRPIITFVKQLPAYTAYTRSVSREAIAARDTINRAREPHRLLFEELPRALQMDPAGISQDQGAADAFAGRLKSVLAELSRAYDMMLGETRVHLYDALGLPVDESRGREEITERALAIHDKVSDLRLKAFAMRLADKEIPYKEWLESVFSCVISKPPRQWNDQDVVRFGVSLAEVAGQFLRVEGILVQARSGPVDGDGARMLRVGVTAESGEDHTAIVRISPEEEVLVGTIVARLESELNQRSGSKRIQDAAVAELLRRALSKSGE